MLFPRCNSLNLKTIIIAIVVVTIIGVCVFSSVSSEDRTESISIQGSTTVSPYMLKVQEVYEPENDVRLYITSNGSGTGAAAAINGSADIAMLSRDLKSSETEAGLVQTVIGIDGIMAIVNDDAGIADITAAQLARIYSGEITNWSELGGNDLGISVISREEGSGTRDGFESILRKAYPDYAITSSTITQASTSAVLSTVNNTTGAIGYVSLGYADKVGSSTTMLSLEGVEPTVKNVQDGTYAMQRNIILATMGEPSGAAKNLIDWILGEEGQDLLQECGFIRGA